MRIVEHVKEDKPSQKKKKIFFLEKITFYQVFFGYFNKKKIDDRDFSEISEIVELWRLDENRIDE